MTKLTFKQSVSAKLLTLQTDGKYVVSKSVALSKSIGTRAGNLDIDMHANGIAAIHTSVQNGDTSSAKALVNNLGKHTRAKALVAWFETHSNIRLVFDKKLDIYNAKLCPADDRLEDQAILDGLLSCEPFWSVPEVAKKDFDDVALALAVARLIKQASDTTAHLSDASKAALADLKVLAVKVPVPVKA
ncbi:hypothetical protein [Aquisediminimonas sediminicola]|uniref:hypothetical protein n=1 Tax=Alteraquisediminimonas sediminicola TaxID=2676787 RepID=UPI001C8D1E3B|nr:hypothetical protein [Aquisediminimonas sediminicola]